VERASFDPEGCLAALDDTRQVKDLNWKRVGNQAHVTASTLTGWPRVSPGPPVTSFRADVLVS
jgi:hypothetical protein